MPPDCIPGRGGVLRSVLDAAGDAVAFLGRFLPLDRGFGALSDSGACEPYCINAPCSDFCGVLGGVVG